MIHIQLEVGNIVDHYQLMMWMNSVMETVYLVTEVNKQSLKKDQHALHGENNDQVVKAMMMNLWMIIKCHG
jgi:hypothetical protein